MKKRLLTSTLLALIAMLTVPITVWGQDFGTEETVSTAKLWTFESYNANDVLSSAYPTTVIDGLYVRGYDSDTRRITVESVSSGSSSYSDGLTYNYNKDAVSATTNNESGITSSYRSAGSNAAIYNCFAFNAEVPGTCYVILRQKDNGGTQTLYFNQTAVDTKTPSDKNTYELKFTSTQKGTFYIASTSAFRIHAIRFVPSLISTWTINVNSYDSGITSGQYINGLYLNPKSGHTIGFSSYKDVTNFKDGTTYSIGRKVSVEGAYSTGDDPIASAMSTRRVANAGMGYDYVAFDVAEAGTAYAIVKTNSATATEGRVFRLGFQSADKSYSYKNKASNTSPTEIQKSNTGPGTYFLYGSEKMDIIAIRFVPGDPKYEVNKSETEHGSVTVKIGDDEIFDATLSTSISVITTPDTGYELSTLTWKNTGDSGDGTDIKTARSFVMPANDVTVSASFSLQNYTISYDLNGGTVETANPESYTYNSEAITLNNPTRGGYTFAGWTGTGLDAATTTVTIAQGSTGDRSYTATWTEIPTGNNVTISPSITNGTISSDKTSAVTSGETVTITVTPDANYRLKSGTLKATYNDGEEKELTITDNTFEMPAYPVTVTAQFERVQVSTTKNWVFNDLTTNTTYNSVTSPNNEYYLRGSASAPDRNFTVKDLTESIQLTFADGISVNASKLIEANGQIVTKVTTDNDVALTATSTAGDATKCGMPTFAFNATVGGTCYAKVKYTGSSSSSVRHRIYFSNGTTITNNSIEVTSGIDEVSFTSTEPGSFFIGDISGSGKYEIYAVRFVPTSEAVKYTLSVSSVEHATITAKVGETTIAEGANAEVIPGSTVTLTAVPDAGYQLVGWKDGSNAALGAVPQSLITTTDMTPAAMTVSATISAQPATPTAITSETTWTFDSFTAETALSGTKPYEYNGLYINGHDNDESNLATIKNGSASKDDFGGSAVNVSKYLYVAGAPNSAPTASTEVNSFIRDAVAFRAGVPGTVYVLMSGAYSTNPTVRTFDIYVNGVKHSTNQDSGNAAIIVSQAITEAANIFIASSGGECKFYAVKFVPAPTYAVTTPTSVENGQVGVDKANAAAGETVTITITPADGYRLKSGTLKATYNNGTSDVELDITNNQFTMPAYAVSVTAQFETLPAIYGTYDFRTFATDNIEFVGENDNVLATVELQNGVMTGKFTYDDPTKGTVTDNTMELNDAFSATNVQLRKKKNTPVSTALLLPKSSTAQLTINRLRAGDWFVIETEADSKLLVKTANANIFKLGSNETLAANETIESGVKYLVSAATSIDLYNNNVANAHIYTVTISNAEAISDPIISDLSEGKVTITAGSSTASGTLKTYYTIDGSAPSASSTEYTAAVSIDQTRIVKAITINTTTSVASNVMTKKIVVDVATPSTIWDFVNDETLNSLTYADETYNGYYINSSGQSKGDGKFKYVTTEKIHSKLSWQIEGSETSNASVGSNGLAITKGGRVFAINDLHVGDKIYITYTNTGETPLKTSIYADHGCSISVNGGETVASGNTTVIASGDEIEIKSTPEGYEYLVLMPTESNMITIQKIEINPAFTLTKGTIDTDITNVQIKVGNAGYADLGASMIIAKGTEVTLKATFAATNKNVVWSDGDDNVLTANNDGTLTLTMDENKTVKATLTTGVALTWIKDTQEKTIARKLNNGLLEVTFNNNGRITAIKDIETNQDVMIDTEDNQRGYFNFNYRPSQNGSVIDAGLECNSSGDIVMIGNSGSNQIELIYPMVDAATPSHQTWKIGYVMKAGVRGIYTYAIMDGSSSYSELHEARYGWRVNPTIFNYAWVSDTQQGAMPTPEQIASPVETVQDATFRLSDNSIYTKYDWANYVKDDQLHGIMGDGIGAWLISPSTEWVNGGPTKQELTVHATETTPIILQTMHSRHYGAASAVLENSSDKKMFGPCLFYVNSGTTQDAMIADAKAKAAAEVNAWPYDWFTNNDDIKSGLALTAADRGTVTGTVNISGDFVTNKVQVVLTQGNKKPLLDGNGYQYYAEATVGNNFTNSFTINHVRPGTYTLYVYALDGDATGTYKKENVTVNAGANDLGTISWMPDKLGVTLWRIGEADRSTKGFKLSDQKRQYGLWDLVVTDQTYTIGSSTEANNWYYAQVKNGGNWSIKFNNTESYTKPLKLTIATAGVAQAPKLEVKLNDKLLNTNGSYIFSNDAAIYRSGVLSGRDSLIVIDVPATYMKVGENTLNLKVSGLDSDVGGGIMYDCIKLEDGSDVSEVIYDFRTWAEAHLSKNGDYHQADIVRDGNGVLTGSFTPQAGETVDGTMTLNGKFSIVGTSDTNINSFKLRKKGTDNNAGSGLLFPRCSSDQSVFIINNLNPGEWFKLDAHASYHLQFAEANANVTQLGRTETVTRETEIIPGTVYKVKDDATAPVSVKICNALSGGAQSFIYSVTISSGEAISEPTIGDLSGGKVTMTGGASTKGGTVKTFYTIDGSTPTSSSAEYTTAVTIDQTRIVKAVTINTTTGIASNVVTKKIKVDAATPSTVWDFKNDASLKPLTYADEVYNGCYVNTNNQDKSDGKFKYVTNEKIHAKLSWQIEGSETANATVGNAGLAITKGGRAFAINDLHVGDKIYITYSNTGDTPLKTSICGNSRGCAISVNGGATVTSGNTTEIASGDEIEIKSTPEGYEYLVLMPTDNKITITKIEINQHVVPEIVPSTPAVYDIAEIVAKGDTLAFSQTGVSVYNMEKSGNNWELKSRSDFYPVTNFSNKVSVRVGSSSLTYNMTAGTMQLRRAMAIHDLSEGDEIVILYSGDGSLISVNSDRSDAFTVGGKAVAAGEEISSGATIKITKTQEDNNYIVMNTSGTVYVQAIYVNTKAPTMVIRPKIELLEIGTTTATYRITHEEGSRLYYILAKEGEEHRASTTGIYDLTIDESDKIKAWAMRSGVTSDTLSTVIYAPTPAPSESGDYDFFEQANELPADLEVTLDPSKSVTVGGQTLYKPTAMTAQTFNDKFAFTETNTTGKIKIRTNRTLAFNKGTNMNMALLNMKQGDIISFDYKGTIAFANTSVIRKETSGVAGARAMTRAETDEMESGAAYVVQQDGDVLLNLSLTEDAISIAKMYVASAPGKSKAAAIDFATAAEEEEDLDQGGAAGVWCHEREAMIKFLRFTNQSDELPINNKVSTENGYGTNTTSGFTSGNRNIAIHNLAKGDTIKVRFAGGAVMYYGHKSYGNRVSVNGKLLQPGDTIHSGDVLKVEQVDYLNNYVVLRVGSKAAISGIFINTLETEKVLMPTITPKSSNTFLITSGVSTVGNEVGTIYTLNGTDPSMVNGTGGPYESFEIQVVHGEEMTIKAMSYSSSGMVSRITTLYYNGSDLTPIESVKVDENGLTEGETIMYDLQGRRVENPRPGNIYIINGKKVVYKRR